jgi:hypothetical protein
MEKIDKYIYKFRNSSNNKSVYLKKIANHINSYLYKQIGGDNKILENNFNSLLNYIQNNISKDVIDAKNTNDKYFVLLYGPPASGKTNARKIACNKIKNEYNESLSEEEILNTFIETGVDEIIYNTNYNDTNIRIQDKLKETYNEELLKLIGKKSYSDIVSGNTNINDNEKIKILSNDDNLNLVASKTFNIYRTGKNIANPVSDLFKFIAIFLNKNIFIESASYYKPYWKSFFELLNIYNYKPIVIYPFTENLKLLCDRNIKRSLSEYRLVSCSGNYGITSNMKNCAKSFEILKIDILNIFLSNTYNKNKKILLYIYDTENININDFNSIKILYQLLLIHNLQNINNITTQIKTEKEINPEFIEKLKQI